MNEATLNEAGITLATAWKSGGPLMWVLAGLSVIALAVILYLLLAHRRGALAPRALISDVFSRLQTGDYGEARRLCQRRPCAFSVIEHNHIYRIATKHEYFGYEIGGIKFHAAVDTVIRRNCIHD